MGEVKQSARFAVARVSNGRSELDRHAGSLGWRRRGTDVRYLPGGRPAPGRAGRLPARHPRTGADCSPTGGPDGGAGSHRPERPNRHGRRYARAPRAAGARRCETRGGRDGRASELYTLLVDRLGDIVCPRAHATDDEPPLGAVWRGVTSGVHRLDDSLVVALDLDRLLDFS